MKRVRIALTEWQKEMLQPLFLEVNKALADGLPGAIIAQVWEGGDSDSFIEAEVLDGAMCDSVQRAIGVKVTNVVVSDTVSVRVPLEESEVRND